MLLCKGKDLTCEVIKRFDASNPIETVVRSSNGDYIYARIKNVALSQKHKIKNHINLKSDDDTYKIVKIALDGTITAITALDTLNGINNLDVTNTGVIIINYLNFNDPKVYSSLYNKRVLASELLSALNLAVPVFQGQLSFI